MLVVEITVGVKKSKGFTLKSDPKSISLSDRLKEFPDQSLRNFSVMLVGKCCPVKRPQ